MKDVYKMTVRFDLTDARERSTAATRRIGYARADEYRTRICCGKMLMKP